MPDLKTLLQTEQQKEQDAQTKVDAGKAAAATLAQVTDVVAQLQALSDGRDKTVAAAQAQLTAAQAQSTKVEGGTLKSAKQTLTTALGKLGLDDTQMNAKATGKILTAPLDPTKTYDDYKQLRDQADADVPTKTATAQASRVAAATARQNVDTQSAALVAAAGAVTATLGSAQQLVADGATKTAGGDLGRAWWSLSHATALCATIDAASLTTQITAYNKSVDDYANAKSQSLADDDALATALATQATAAANLLVAGQQVGAALADLVKSKS
jgi:hypothetical protein